MTETNGGAQFEIIVDGKPRSYRDVKAVAIEAALFLKECRPTQEVSAGTYETAQPPPLGGHQAAHSSSDNASGRPCCG